jgi:Ca2+-binding EF-hand superfamily protein
MGGNVSVPEADANTKKAMLLAYLKPKEIKRLYKCFKKFDKNKIGKYVYIDEWMVMID